MTESSIITDDLKPTHSTEVDSCGCAVVPDKVLNQPDQPEIAKATEVDSCGCDVVPDKMLNQPDLPLIAKAFDTIGKETSMKMKSLLSEAKADCPESGTSSKKVSLETLENLILQDKRHLISKDAHYYNCSDPECEVVYFSIQDTPSFNIEDLSVKVFAKDNSKDVHVCYCFDWTRERITDQIKSEGRSTVLDEVRDELNAGNCECELKNPKGVCCLGDIQRYLKEIA